MPEEGILLAAQIIANVYKKGAHFGACAISVLCNLSKETAFLTKEKRGAKGRAARRGPAEHV